MNDGRSLVPWIVAGAALVVTIGFVFVDPWSGRDQVPQEAREELESTVGKASTYYEFGHFDRAAESYALAIERGMTDALELYRYARSLELASGLDLDAYMEAYRRLLEQTPGHEYLEETQAILMANAVEFAYTAAEEDEIDPDTLVRFAGTIARIEWGRVEANEDLLYVATRPDHWIGHSGDVVRVEAPRHRRFRTGDTITVLGRYEGWCTVSDGAGLSVDYPCVEAAGVRLASTP